MTLSYKPEQDIHKLYRHVDEDSTYLLMRKTIFPK